MTVIEICVLIAGVAASKLAELRYLRIAQREHYLVGAPTRFAIRWWRLSRLGPPLALVALASGVVSIFVTGVGLVAAVVVGAGPLGLGVRGRTGKLVWTRRLRALAGILAVLELAALGFGLGLGGLRAVAVVAIWCALAAPLFVDAALAIARPVEDRLAERFVERAATRLAAVAPRVVAITGSYGKTSTKQYVAHLLGGRLTLVASPRSFNNRAGLARTVNEQVTPGTEVLVAEMGTYGPGEIAEMCRWLPPEIAVITAIGPVHLERFGALEVTLRAKAEITTAARVVVLNVDDERLAGLADELEASKKLFRCSASDREADVAVIAEHEGLRLFVHGRNCGPVELAPEVLVAPTNLACAIAVALELGLPESEVGARLSSLRAVESRLVVSRSASGVVVLDDTFNSNPAGARRALEELDALGRADARRVVVTPGMIELGPLQGEENTRLAAAVIERANDLVIVGRTNRRALLEGASRSAGTPDRAHLVADRARAVAWVRSALGEGDAVLYENDLPDHYP